MKVYLVVRHFNKSLPFPGSVNNLLLGAFYSKDDAIQFLRRFYDLDSVSLIESSDFEMKANHLEEIPMENRPVWIITAS